jgi:hypothetical protein
MTDSSFDNVPIGTVAVFDGIPYLAGYQAAGNNPVIFSLAGEQALDASFCVASQSGRRSFPTAQFDAAVAEYRRVLRQNSYRPAGKKKQRMEADTSDVSRPNSDQGIGHIRVGQALVYLSGYFGDRNHPLAYAYRTSGIDRIVVVGRGTRSEFTIGDFEMAMAAYRSLVVAAAKPAPTGCLASVAVIAAGLAALLK